MKSAEWSRVRPLLERLFELPREEHEAYLEESCAGDVALKRRVLALFAAEESDAGFLEFVPPPAPPSATALPRKGQRLGAWQLLEEIGSGGMGTVWLAERADQAFEKRAAVKLLGHGALGAELLDRFRAERQVLAGLEHPNIARLLDGGTTEDGLPYLVMELVDGLPIDRHCEEKGLEPRARIALFRRVCDAVQYAHANLVVHRDLKPSNVLVSADGEPKLLDFGIAKVLEADAGLTAPHARTRTGARQLTPRYASPEQIRGRPPTTATDVYSLGVLLYEVLTGAWPWDVDDTDLAELARSVCEEDPLPPSTRVRAGLDPDLDRIVAMALRKEPERRYASVEMLSEDLRRFLAGLPVLAQPDTFAYRTRKLVRRSPWLVGSLVALFLALTIGVVTSTHLYRQARHAREVADEKASLAQAAEERAERRFQEVRGLAGELMFDVYGEVEHLPGATAARERLVRTALTYLDGLAHEVANEPELVRELALGYKHMADALGHPGRANLGRVEEALESYAKSLAWLEELSAADPSDLKLRRQHAAVLLSVGSLELEVGRTEEGLSRLQEARALAEESGEGGGADALLLSDAMHRLGVAQIQLGLVEEARSSLEEALQLLDEVPPGPDRRRAALLVEGKLGQLHAASGERAAAESFEARALANAEALVEAEPENFQAQRDLAIAVERVASRLVLENHLDEAEPLVERFHGLALELVRADPQNAEAETDLVRALALRAVLDERRGDLEGAHAANAEALRIAERRAQRDLEDHEATRHVAHTLLNLASNRIALGRLEEAAQSTDEAIAILERLRHADPLNFELQKQLTAAQYNRAQMAEKGGALERAREAYDRFEELSLDLADARPADAWCQRGVMVAHHAAGRVRFDLAEAADLSQPTIRTLAEEAVDRYALCLAQAERLEGQGLLSPPDQALLDEVEETRARWRGILGALE